MKKIISPLVLAALLIWTWQVIHTPSAIGFETHSGVQIKLAELIGNTLQSKKPEAENLRIVKIWTSPVSENKIRAVFTYSFLEPDEQGGSAEKFIQGEAMLHREPTEDPTIDKWILQSIETELESLNFTDGSVVTSGGSHSENPEAADSSSETPSQMESTPATPGNHQPGPETKPE